MKKTLYTLALVLPVSLLFNACKLSNEMNNGLSNNAVSSKSSVSNCFIQKKDGSVINYGSLHMVNAVFNDAYLLADNKTRIYPKEIVAYQTNEYYAVSQSQFSNGRKSHVAITCLPGFGMRIAKGKLNVYTKQYFNGTLAVDEYYLQSGDDGPIKVFSPILIKELLQNDAKAIGYFKSNHKQKPLRELLTATASLVNADRSVTKN